MQVMAKYFLTAAICFSLAALTFGQNSENMKIGFSQTAPSYTLQVNLNYDKSILELSGTIDDNVRSEYIYDGKTYGADKGFGCGVVSKIGIGKSKMVRLTQVLAYNRLLSYAFKDNKALADIGEANYNVFTGSAGIEYSFMPIHKFRVYMGGEVNASTIYGDMRIWFERRGNPLGDSVASYSVSNSFRIGYGFFAGAEYILKKNLGLNFGFKLVNLNAFLRKAEGSNDDKEFSLRDDNNPGLIFSGTKNFSFYSIFAGVCFYFGVN
jgi:hypothetical protein